MNVTPVLFGLDLPAGEIATLHASLDADEQAQAGRFRASQDANRFIARRGQLRLLLASVTGRPPASIRIERTAAGKPYVAGAPHFSLSCSGPVALFVSAPDAIGCDIERRDPDLADRAIAERLFAPAERRALANLPARQWAEGFFNCWTRKEAVVKALGHGLLHSLDGFEVTLAPGTPAALRTPIGACRLHAFAWPGPYHVAICIASDRAVLAPRWVDPVSADWRDAA